MKSYLNLLDDILHTGNVRKNRTGIDTVGKNFYNITFNLQYGKSCPIVTTKQLNHKSVLGELLGFIRGLENASGFRSLGCNVWNGNANDEGVDEEHPNRWLTNKNRKGKDDLGRIYGAQWRDWEDTKIRDGGIDLKKDGYKEVAQFLDKGSMKHVWTRRIDQLSNVINTLKKSPTDRRSIITGWNPGEMDEMALPPCHLMQHYLCEEINTRQRIEAYTVREENRAIWETSTVEGKREEILKWASEIKEDEIEAELDKLGCPKYKIDLIMYQRSADSVLGIPYNITSYGMMLHMMGRMTGYAPGNLYYVTGDTHVYTNHTDAVNEQLRRVPSSENTRFVMNPKLNTLKDFERALPKDFRIFNYINQGVLKHKTPMAV